MVEYLFVDTGLHGHYIDSAVKSCYSLIMERE